MMGEFTLLVFCRPPEKIQEFGRGLGWGLPSWFLVGPLQVARILGLLGPLACIQTKWPGLGLA